MIDEWNEDEIIRKPSIKKYNFPTPKTQVAILIGVRLQILSINVRLSASKSIFSVLASDLILKKVTSCLTFARFITRPNFQELRPNPQDAAESIERRKWLFSHFIKTGAN